MRRVLLLAAIAGCNFSSPDDNPPGGDAPGGDAPGGDAPADAAPDAAPFDPRACPQGYALTLASIPDSRYRIITTNAVLQSQYTACTTTGLTHLMALETAEEAAAISAALQLAPSPPTNGWYYVGAVQRRNQSAVDAGWLWLTEGTVAPALWGISGPVPEPDDENSVENNTQNLAVLDAAMGKMNDVSGMTAYGAVCECDGKGIAPAAEAELP